MRIMKTIDKQNFPQGQEVGKTLDVLERILKAYSAPSFGSMTKRDTDIMLFMALQDLGILEKTPSIYDVIQLLHVTRSKARNLIYECSLRRQEEQNLDQELKKLIVKPIFMRDGDKVCIEVDNPLLIDYIRQSLKTLGHITDSSFNAELVKMRPEAFAALYTSLLPEGSINTINARFIALGVQEDRSPQALVIKVIKVIAHAALGKAGESFAGTVCETLGNWFSGVFDHIPDNGADLHGTMYEELNIA